MSYYRICPKCGAALDPGEKCDCEREREQTPRTESDILREEITRLIKTADVRELRAMYGFLRE